MLPRLICAALCVAAVLCARPDSASAQPGKAVYVAPPPQPLQLRLSEEDLEILERGEISTAQYILGGALGSYFGFGVGHMIQQRWYGKGWIFTLGESAGITALVAGLVSCSRSESDRSGTRDQDLSWSEDDGCPLELVVGGAVAYGGFRLWEIIDLWAAPPIHNNRLRELQRRQQPRRYGFSIVPRGRSSGVASFSLSF